MNKMEIWKAIKDFEGLYEVSNLARVKSLNYNHTGIEEILKLYLDKDSYLKVRLYKNGKVFNKTVHRLVAEAFIPNPKNKPTVDHINKIRDDNRVENLQWFTQREQVVKSIDQGRVNSEKQRQKAKEACQIISTWINEKLNLEFIGNSLDLVRAFPEHKLSFGNLSSVRRKERKQHKGWKVKI